MGRDASTMLLARIDAMQERLTRLERGLALVADAVGVSLPEVAAEPGAAGDPVIEHALELVRNGQRMQAIAYLQDQKGLGLREATEEVGRLAGTI